MTTMLSPWLSTDAISQYGVTGTDALIESSFAAIALICPVWRKIKR
jgi:hypothetical protein